MNEEPTKITALRKEQTEAFEAQDWPRMRSVASRIVREWARFHAAEARKLKRAQSVKTTELK